MEPSNKTESLQVEKNDYESSSSAAVTINFVNSALAGALGFMGNVFSVSQLGIFWFVFGSFISMVLTHFSIQFLCRSAELSKSVSTHNLAFSQFGQKGSIITKLFVCIGNWSFIVNIIQIFADFAPQILRNWFHDSSFLTSRWFAVIIGLIIIFPWVLVRNISKLEKLSVLCIFYAMFIFIVLGMNAIKCIINNDIHSNVDIVVTDPYNIFLGLPTISWCWGLQFNALPIYFTLSPNSRISTINNISLLSVFIIFIFYVSQGIAVYLVWADSINTDFVTNLDHDNDNYEFYYKNWLATLTQFIIAISCFFSIPILAFESRTNLHAIISSVYKSYKHKNKPSQLLQNELINDELEIINADVEETCLSRWIEGSFICISAALVAMLVSNLNLCLTLAGATYSCYVAYFLPSTVYIMAMNKSCNLTTSYDKILRYIAIFSICYGVMVCVAGVIAALI